MSKVMRVQRIIMPKSTLPKDRVVNTFYFQRPVGSGAILAAEAAAVCAELDTFFNTASGGLAPVRNYLAETAMAGGRTTYKCYDMDDASPRAPIHQPTAANPTPVISTGPLPSEVACCLSFAGPPISGQSQGRRRGRVYIGPLNISVLFTDVTTGQAAPWSEFVSSLTQSANRLHDNVFALSPSWDWVVYSPTKRALGGDAFSACTAVTTAWVDNAFDTQRRRGQQPSARTTIAL